MMSSFQQPEQCHFDVVGSFLRPESLTRARSDFEEGRIVYEQMRVVEDAAIRNLIEKQTEAGLIFFTDGEFRRYSWDFDFMWGFHGVDRRRDSNDPEIGVYLKDKISVSKHPFIEHFEFVKTFEKGNAKAKQTIPSPSQFFHEMIFAPNLKNTGKFYPTNQELIDDIVFYYRQVIQDLYAAGCRNLQLDDCAWCRLLDIRAPSWYGVDSHDRLQEILEQFLWIHNLVMKDRPEDLFVSLHVCRGDYQAEFFSRRAYDSIEEPLFAKTDVDSYHYYWALDDKYSGGAEPLAYVSGEKHVCLGLISSNHSCIEDRDAVVSRIYEAASYIPLERLSLSPQCGFASCEGDHRMTEEEQWKKISFVKEIAKEIWG
ncbi:5-methyltetrahydropteroyltriglutamate--homocysteine methyltransferase [Chlamydia pneumoniae]|uniref:5-methyltetrahydropteroyltriglutamate-- homocysteine methyltransferase n=1 Tax=Chlamydia pneumoniae TaxID=83558 RepID=UPI0002FCF6D7|nr:5-methyltetrahydropteroyltriglutamate--homocysteine methyltransferase [Chlamydia pneumoniae]ETR80341.1 Methionine synthase II (cobalamin-independent) [Chlamydia pneumoniae B21]